MKARTAEARADRDQAGGGTGSPAGPGARRWLPLGLCVLVSSVIVAAAFSSAPHTGGDNAAYVTLAYSLVANGEYSDLYDPAQLPHTKYPPVFPAALAVLILLGARTWVTLKLVAAVSTVAAVTFTYLWAERRLGSLSAFGVAGVLAVSSATVYYSHWVLSDPLFVALTVAALWLLDRSDADDAPSWVLPLGVAAAGLAYFTRSAGLPLLVALFVWLALRRRWRALGASAVGIGLPALLWLLRGRNVGVADYGAEFWMVDPYQPALGTVGVAGLLGRAGSNLLAYVLQHGPSGVLGPRGGVWVGAFGVALTALALFGWFRAVRVKIGPAELFLPLYGGLILVWPEVWSGDRFALPLFPVLFLFAGLALRQLTMPLKSPARAGIVFVAMALTLVPATRSWVDSVVASSACSVATRAGGAWACYGSGVADFAAAAEWSGRALPEGASVMTRKPRMFYVLSGVPSRTFPFDGDPAVQLSQADAVGATFTLIDRWDGLAGRYVGEAVQRYPQAFCAVRQFGSPEAPTYLFGIRPRESRGTAVRTPGDEVEIRGCAPGTIPDAADDGAYSASTSSRIPLLRSLDP